MKITRASGILLHPTSLPGPFGIGDVGKSAFAFVDFLAKAGQRYWQILPFGPTGYGDSPYQCFSAFAGNPLLIDLFDLVEKTLLSPHDLESIPDFPKDKVDYGWVMYYKYPLLRKAFENYKNHPCHAVQQNFARFCEKQWYWLDDYALFLTLRDVNDCKVWNQWDWDIAVREVDALAYFSEKLAFEIEEKKFWQFLFFDQWARLKEYCQSQHVRIIGDMPIYVAYDSVDVWANRDIFHLDDEGKPTKVAGVPPDYFSQTGQRWGNPLYRWDYLQKTGYPWWVERFRSQMENVDLIRLDHFCGFESCWEIPAHHKTAEHGRWAKVPGEELFNSLRADLGSLPIIAEDLGLITPEVRQLRERLGFPGMAVLQFAFGTDDETHPYLPHNYTSNLVVYTGTHDNDTLLGWIHETSSDQERNRMMDYLKSDGQALHWDAIQCVMDSAAGIVLFPLQDVFGLGNEARMNHPGKSSGNWQWRFVEDALSADIANRLYHITQQGNRLGE
jgi:4-alpha-glucanotransferase